MLKSRRSGNGMKRDRKGGKGKDARGNWAGMFGDGGGRGRKDGDAKEGGVAERNKGGIASQDIGVVAMEVVSGRGLVWWL